MPFELPVQTPVPLLLELEANLLDQNVNELEFELSRTLVLVHILVYLHYSLVSLVLALFQKS